MITPQDRFEFEMHREPTMEGMLPPRFLRGDKKHERPFRPIGSEIVIVSVEPWSVSLVELVGLGAFCLTIGFIAGYWLAFTH